MTDIHLPWCKKRQKCIVIEATQSTFRCIWIDHITLTDTWHYDMVGEMSRHFRCGVNKISLWFSLESHFDNNLDYCHINIKELYWFPIFFKPFFFEIFLFCFYSTVPLMSDQFTLVIFFSFSHSLSYNKQWHGTCWVKCQFKTNIKWPPTNYSNNSNSDEEILIFHYWHWNKIEFSRNLWCNENNSWQMVQKGNFNETI